MLPLARKRAEPMAANLDPLRASARHQALHPSWPRACSRLISPSDCLSENRTMQLTAEQFEQIAPWLPRQRGNVRLANLQVVNAMLYVAANGCKWRALPSNY